MHQDDLLLLAAIVAYGLILVAMILLVSLSGIARRPRRSPRVLREADEIARLAWRKAVKG